MKKTEILLVDSDSASRMALARVLTSDGHRVAAVASLAEAEAMVRTDSYDLILAIQKSEQPDSALQTKASDDLVSADFARQAGTPFIALSFATTPVVTRMFPASAASCFLAAETLTTLDRITDQSLATVMKRLVDPQSRADVNEVVEIELPDDLNYLDGVLSYLLERAAAYGIVQPNSSNTFVALDEALSNAIRHGNKNDPAKTVYIRLELSRAEARFIIRDEGAGFNPADVPDPLAPANLYKSSGRGVLLIRSIMDEVHYNERGNEVTMIKRPELPKQKMA